MWGCKGSKQKNISIASLQLIRDPLANDIGAVHEEKMSYFYTIFNFNSLKNKLQIPTCR